jgi:hypothetical protein
MNKLDEKLEKEETLELSVALADSFVIFTLDGILENIEKSKYKKAILKGEHDKGFLDAICLTCYAKYDKELVYELDEKDCFFRYKE